MKQPGAITMRQAALLARRPRSLAHILRWHGVPKSVWTKGTAKQRRKHIQAALRRARKQGAISYQECVRAGLSLGAYRLEAKA